MFADATGVGVLELPTSAIFESITGDKFECSNMLLHSRHATFHKHDNENLKVNIFEEVSDDLVNCRMEVAITIILN